MTTCAESKRITALAGLALAAAVALNSAAFTISDTPTRKAVPLKLSLPVSIPGWNCRDLSLGRTERGAQVAADILGFDDYVYREYTSNALRVNVYIAYWNPGTASSRDVRGHIPDNCWVAAGWRLCPERVSVISLKPLDRFQHRAFKSEMGRVEVAYAHIVRQRFYTHKGSIWDDLVEQWRLGIRGKYSQYLMRISTNGSLSDIGDTAPIMAVREFLYSHIMCYE